MWLEQCKGGQVIGDEGQEVTGAGSTMAAVRTVNAKRGIVVLSAG